jgi:peptide/nickel transport system substrate-binding protein
MKLIGWRWLALSSVLVAVLARGETRPQYGGTLRVATRAAFASLDPADNTQADSFARRSVTLLMFETLVANDDNSRPRSGLAITWQASAGNQHWQFHLRRGVQFHDGSPLTAEVAAASLRSGNPTWNVTAEGDSVTIDCGSPDPELLAELALPRNAIVKRNSNLPSGTGPFHFVNWQPGKEITLVAEEGYWGGRPFIDGIEIEMGKSFRDQMTALDSGKVDLIDVAPEQAHAGALAQRRVASSAPMELLALLFTRDAQTADEKLLRQALADSIERGSIRSVLLQGAGQPAGAVLPDWMSGYGFVFPTDADLPRARHTREQVRTIPNWTIAYDSGDPRARLLAERVALNGKDAGLSLQPTSTGNGDLRLLRIPLASTDPWITLAQVFSLAGVVVPKSKGGSIEELYLVEHALLTTQRLIPLFHLPTSYMASGTVKNWNVRADGTLSLSNASMGNGIP